MEENERSTLKTGRPGSRMHIPMRAVLNLTSQSESGHPEMALNLLKPRAVQCRDLPCQARET